MKYLKRFNESYQYIADVRSNCEDILLPFSDKGVEYEIYGYEGVREGDSIKEMIRIEIGGERNSEESYKTVKLKDYELEFDHLLSYLKEEGFVLGGNSYFENSSWEYYECCPKCGSEIVSPPDDLQSMNGWSCGKCKHEGHQDDFQKPEHPIREKDLIWGIKQSYHIDFMLLTFIKTS